MGELDRPSARQQNARTIPQPRFPRILRRPSPAFPTFCTPNVVGGLQGWKTEPVVSALALCGAPHRARKGPAMEGTDNDQEVVRLQGESHQLGCQWSFHVNWWGILADQGLYAHPG